MGEGRGGGEVRGSQAGSGAVSTGVSISVPGTGKFLLEAFCFPSQEGGGGPEELEISGGTSQGCPPCALPAASGNRLREPSPPPAPPQLPQTTRDKTAVLWQHGVANFMNCFQTSLVCFWHRLESVKHNHRPEPAEHAGLEPAALGGQAGRLRLSGGALQPERYSRGSPHSSPAGRELRASGNLPAYQSH